MPEHQRLPQQTKPAKILAWLGSPIETEFIPSVEDLHKSNFIRTINERSGSGEIIVGLLGRFGLSGEAFAGYLDEQYKKYQDEIGSRPPQEIDALAEANLSQNAAITLAIANLQEAMDDFRGTQFRDVIDRAGRFGKFAVVQAIHESAEPGLKSAS